MTRYLALITLNGRPHIEPFEIYLNIISRASLVLGIDILFLLITTCNYLKVFLRKYTSTNNDKFKNRLIFIVQCYLIVSLFFASISLANLMAEFYLKKRIKENIQNFISGQR